MSLDLLDSVEQSFSPTEVGIHEFAESEAYCSKALYPSQIALLKLIFLEDMTGPEEDIITYWMEGGRGGGEIAISPNIRERRDFLRENGYKHFREVQLVGGRRSSKGFCVGIAMAYVMLGCLKLGDPGTHYGIDKEKNIFFSCIAGSESQAKEFQFADLSSTIETCKAFEPYLVNSLETEIRVATPVDLRKVSQGRLRGQGGGNKFQRDVARLRGKALAANAGTIRGSATMVYAMDEVAWMIPGESKASAAQVYGAADPSLDQFGLDGMAFLASSPYTKVGLFYEMFEANMRPFDPSAPIAFSNILNLDKEEIALGNGNPRNFCLQFPSWALFENYRYFSTRYKRRERGKMFGKMITVSPDWNPEETDDKGRPPYSVEDKAQIIQARAKEATNPETFKVERRGKWAEVADAYLNPAMVDQMYKGVPDGFEALPNGDYVRRFRPLITNYGTSAGIGVATNLYRYKFHVDPSSTTAGFGFAIAHIENFPDPVSGQSVEHVVFDLIRAWHPGSFPGKVIKWEPILDEITTYAAIFRPFEITFDQHQSMQPIQDLQERLNNRGIQCRVYEKYACQPLDARVLTPYGWTTMGDIQVGDAVIGSNGESCSVIGVYPQDELKTVYRVTFSDGSATECTDDHLWRVRSHGERGCYHTLTLQEILDRGLRHGDTGSWKWRVDHVRPVVFQREDDLPIDPYLLGSLLGDGCFHKSVAMVVARDDADEQVELMRPLLPEGMTITRRNHGGWDTLYFKKPDGSYINPLSAKIRELGLWHISGSSKFIPERYLYASIENRIRLLQGLMDTDGCIGATSYCVKFTTTSWALAYGVQDLVGSLGGSASIRKTAADRSTLDVFIKRLPTGIVPFSLQRKVNRYPNSQRSGAYRFITGVEFIGLKETQCIRVSAEDHLYVTDDYIVTHNTAELNWKRFEFFKTALYQGLVHAPYDEEGTPAVMGSGQVTSREELKFLQQISTTGKYPRIDKQDLGPVQTKDRVDAIVECAYTLIGNIHFTHMRERLANASLAGGSPGGYGIGQGPLGGPGPPGISEYYSRSEEKFGQAGRSALGQGALGRGGRVNKVQRTRGRWN